MNPSENKAGHPAFTRWPYKTGGRGRHILPSLYALWPSLVAASEGAVRISSLLPGKRWVKFANDLEVEVPETGMANAMEPMTSFRILQRDGLLLPYGDYQHRKGMQRFNAESAAAMARNFVNPPEWVKKLYRWVTGEALGIPIFIGHPDVPELRAKYLDTKAYGWVEGIEPRADGAFVRIKWSEPGQALINNNHYRYYSPYWFGSPQRDGSHLMDFLRSIGLTNEPNMPVPAIANEATTATNPPENPDNNMNKEIIKKLAALLGIAEDSDETAFENAVTALDKKSKDQEAELKDLRGKLPVEKKPEDPKPGAETDKVAMENALADVKAATKALRTERVGLVLDSAITQGRLAPADRDSQITRIVGMANEADVTSALDELRKGPVKFKVVSVTGDAAGAREAVAQKTKELQDRDANRQAMANAIEDEVQSLMRGGKSRSKVYNAAYAEARRKHPNLFK